MGGKKKKKKGGGGEGGSKGKEGELDVPSLRLQDQNLMEMTDKG